MISIAARSASAALRVGSRAFSGAWPHAHFCARSLAPTPLTEHSSHPAQSPGAAAKKATIQVTFVKPDGSKQTVSAPVGDSMLEVAHANKSDIEGASSIPAPRAAPQSPPLTPPAPLPPYAARRRLRRRDCLLHLPPVH